MNSVYHTSIHCQWVGLIVVVLSFVCPCLCVSCQMFCNVFFSPGCYRLSLCLDNSFPSLVFSCISSGWSGRLLSTQRLGFRSNILFSSFHHAYSNTKHFLIFLRRCHSKNTIPSNLQVAKLSPCDAYMPPEDIYDPNMLAGTWHDAMPAGTYDHDMPAGCTARWVQHAITNLESVIQ